MTNHQKFDVQTCMTPDLERPNYLLLGDSHAAHLWLGLSSALSDVNVSRPGEHVPAGGFRGIAI